MTYLLLWILFSIVAFSMGKLLCIWIPYDGISTLELLLLSAAVSALLVANELRKPTHKEYLRRKALFPKIPNRYLQIEPISSSVVFGRDHRTKKLVMAEPGHHTLIVGSTGSGKTATSLIPSILACDTGSKQIIDIKSRELAYKTASIHDEKTMIIDMNLRKDYVWGWDVFYKLRKDGTDTEQEVLSVLQEIASIVVPKPTSETNSFWREAALNEYIGIALYEFCYCDNYEFCDIVKSMLEIPLRAHLESALENVPQHSLVNAYLTNLASTEDETLFSIDITLGQNLYLFLSLEALYFFRDNPKRANPAMLNEDGITQYICVDEHKLDTGFDKIMNIVMKQSLMEIQSRTTSGNYPQTMLYLDEWQRLTQSVEEIRQLTASFLKTGRSKHASVVLCCQNLDNFKKEQIYDIISNIHYLYVLSSNNSNSLTSEVVCKMAGMYYEKTKNYSDGKTSSVSTSFQEKQILKPEDLNNLGEDAVLLISNYGYVRTHKEGTAYYKTEPFKSQYEKIIKTNKEAMNGV